MALIFADDFKQWPNALSGISYGSWAAQITGTQAIIQYNELQALGYYPPAFTLGTTGDGSRYRTIMYDTNQQALAIVQPVRSTVQSVGASGMRRAFSYTGDTMYFGCIFEIFSASAYSGNFLFFGPNVASQGDFTQADPLLESSFTHKVGIDGDGNFTFNGNSTGVQAWYLPTTVKFYIDVVFTPTVVELWINDVKVYTEPNLNLKMREFAISAFTFGNTNGGVWLYSVAIADNTEGYAQRFGRKSVRTQQVQTITTVLTKSAVPAATTELALIRKTADTPYAETGGNILGHLFWNEGYVGADITVPGFTGKEIVYGAALQIQSKRLAPSGDGLGIRPYVTVSGVKKYGNVGLPSSTWKQYTMEVPMTDVAKNTTTFGLMFDYTDPNKLYIDDRQKIEVYGEPSPSPLTGYLGEVIYSIKNIANIAYSSISPEYAQQTLTTSKVDVNPTEWKADVNGYSQQTMTTAMYDVMNTSYSKEE